MFALMVASLTILGGAGLFGVGSSMLPDPDACTLHDPVPSKISRYFMMAGVFVVIVGLGILAFGGAVPTALSFYIHYGYDKHS